MITEAGRTAQRILRTDKRMVVVPHRDLAYKIIGCAMSVHNGITDLQDG